MKLFGIISLFMLAMLATTPATAGDKNTTVEKVTVTAMAETEEKAISKALAQAIQQVNGAQVEVNTRIGETGRQLVIDWYGNKTILEGQEINQGFTSVQAAGPVRSYRVLSSNFLKDQKQWQVRIEAAINKFRNIGADRSNLTQLAVMPFRSAREQFKTVGGVRSASAVAAELGTLLTDHFVQSQRFRVLDRNFWQESAREELITQNFSSATQESIKHGQKLGADYMLVGMINKFDVIRKEEKSYDSVSNRYEAEFDLSLRVIEVATSDIIWSETFTRKFGHQELRAKVKALRGNALEKTEAEAASAMQEALYDTIAAEISQQVTNHFYPIRVLGTADGVTLNRGGNLVTSGEVYEITSAPVTVPDPDTGLAIRTRGKVLATVRVDAVFADHATASLVTGSLQNIKKGDIATLQATAMPAATGAEKAPRPLTPGSSEEPLKWQ